MYSRCSGAMFRRGLAEHRSAPFRFVMDKLSGCCWVRRKKVKPTAAESSMFQTKNLGYQLLFTYFYREVEYLQQNNQAEPA